MANVISICGASDIPQRYLMFNKRTKVIQPAIRGILIGFSKRWNPLSTEVFARVKLDNEVINVPIDYRQQTYIQMEHPINSLVPLIFQDGKWHIASNQMAAEQRSFIDKSVF